MQLRRDGFVRPTFGDEFEGEAASQISDPLTRGFMQVLLEEALELSQGYGAESRHHLGLEIGFPCQLFPVVYLQKAFTHRFMFCFAARCSARLRIPTPLIHTWRKSV